MPAVRSSSKSIRPEVHTIFLSAHNGCRRGLGFRATGTPTGMNSIYVLDGAGTALLEDQRVPIQKGATIFIPKGSWHGFENPGTDLFILWAATPTGQEEFFRAISSQPGDPPRNLTAEQTIAIRAQVEADSLKRVQSQP